MEGMVDPRYWNDRKVLVTGHTGFKGSWLCHWLLQMGSEVAGYALPPETRPGLFELLHLEQRMRSINADITDAGSLTAVILDIQPDVIFHLAAQPLVRAGYEDPMTTFSTNVMGTANLLQSIRQLDGPCTVIVVSSDKCYVNTESHHHYTEDDPLGGHDPYSASKACTEIVTHGFRESFHIGTNRSIASVRAGNVIGGGDWARDRLIPDMVRAWTTDQPLQIRNPDAVRPWQHVLEPLSGYLALAEQIPEHSEYCRAWNFGPERDEAVSVRGLIELARKFWPDLEIRIDENPGPHEAGLLLLDSGAARRELGWQSRWRADEALRRTYEWYSAWRRGDDMLTFTSSQIHDYLQP